MKCACGQALPPGEVVVLHIPGASGGQVQGPLQTGPLDVHLEYLGETGLAKRFGQVVVGTEFQRLHRGLFGAVAGEDHHHGEGVFALDPAEDLAAVDLGDVQVEDDRGGLFP